VGRVGGMGGGGRAVGVSRSSVFGGGFRGGGGGGSRVASRPGSSRAGGLVPNKNVGGANINKSQVASMIQSRPKGTGLVQGAQGGQVVGRLHGGSGGQLGSNLSPRRNQATADRQKYWHKWGKDNQGQLADFRTNRGKDWNKINNFWNNRNPSDTFNKPEWNNYKNDVNDFRNSRSVEINYNVQNHFDNNFNDTWWAGCGWWRGPVYSVGNPWWWWGAATFATVGRFLALDATYQPPVYDYGVNVVYHGDEVYVDGEPDVTAEQYSQQATELANSPAEQPPPPVPPEAGQQAEWLPLGVWALTQEDKGDAYMFVQISIDKNGVVTGAYQNVLSGDKSPISGQVDKKTQRVAWKIGSNNTVIETGLQNLTQDVASCLVHFGPDTTQTWLLVRLKQPEMPNAPRSATAETKDS
jgi:hypothetical protein